MKLVLVAGLVVSTNAMSMGLGWGDDPPPPEQTTKRPVIDRVVGLKGPTRIEIDSAGRVYVSDTQNGAVTILSSTGEKVGSLRGLIAPLGLGLLDIETTVEKPMETCVPSPDIQEQIDQSWVRYHRLEQRILSTKQQIAVAPSRRRWLENRIKRQETRLQKLLAGIESLHIELAELECTVAMVPEQIIIHRTYVGDDGDGSVRIFEEDQPVGTLGGGADEFLKPNGIAVTSDGTVYVVDSSAHHIVVYDSEGNLQGSFGTEGVGDGNLMFPTDIAINEALSEIYISDFNNGRIAVFRLDGSWARNITAPLNSGGDPAFYRVSGIGIDPVGNLYVVDNALSCLVVITNQGGLLDIIGYDNGQYWTGDLFIPVDAASDGATVWVSSSKEGSINAYEVTP